MNIAYIEFDADSTTSAILAKQRRIEQIIADSITVDWKRTHIVFNCVHKDGDNVIFQTVAYRATDVYSVDIRDE